MWYEEDTGIGIREVMFRSTVSLYHWFSFTPMTDACSLSLAVAILRSGLCFRFNRRRCPCFGVGFRLL